MVGTFYFLLIFPFQSHGGNEKKKKEKRTKSWGFSPLFYSKNFIVLPFTFRASINLELLCYVVWDWEQDSFFPQNNILLTQPQPSLFYFLGAWGWVWDLSEGFAYAKQALYCLSHTSSPFYCGYLYFGDVVSRTICPGQPQTVILKI
jgi:hypothetical protein